VYIHVHVHVCSLVPRPFLNHITKVRNEEKRRRKGGKGLANGPVAI